MQGVSRWHAGEKDHSPTAFLHIFSCRRMGWRAGRHCPAAGSHGQKERPCQTCRLSQGLKRRRQLHPGMHLQLQQQDLQVSPSCPLCQQQPPGLLGEAEHMPRASRPAAPKSLWHLLGASSVTGAWQ